MRIMNFSPVKLIREAFLLPVKAYRKYLSPLKSTPTCRFTPTCSQYAIDAVREWGIVAGTVLTIFRIVRCNPFSKGGEDPVPHNPFKRR
jgi:putative membrane protein insertion efficiency factor